MPLHVRAEPGEVAPLVLLPGDPARAERIAERLTGVSCYNRYRSLLGFTGEAKGTRISVQTTGMGAPSTGIVTEELLQLGARVLVRVGTCGAVRQDIRPGALLVATASCPLDGTTAQYTTGAPYAPAASFAVTRALVEAAEQRGAPVLAGLVATDDAFYNPESQHEAVWAARGVLAFEMEASALFTIAAIRGVQAGCILTVANTSGALDWLAGTSLEGAIDTMIDVALAAAPALARLAEG